MASGDVIDVLYPHDWAGPDTSYARPDRRDSGDGFHSVLDFALNEIAHWESYCQDFYSGGGLTLNAVCAMSTATTGDVKLEMSIERLQLGTTDLDVSSFAAANGSSDTTVSASAGVPFNVQVTFADGADMDSLAAGEFFRLKVKRVAVAGTDAAGDLELKGIVVLET